jgi:hypothetical protein
MARIAAESVGARATVITNPGCPIARLVIAMEESDSCRSYEDSVLAQLRAQGRPGDIVFLASLRVQRYGDQWALFEKQDFPDELGRCRTTRAMAQGEICQSFRREGFHVLIDAPKPIFKAPPFRCSDWFNGSNPICEPGFEVTRDELLQRRRPAMDAIRKLQQEEPADVVWDPFPYLCQHSTCSAFDGEKPIFFDGDHLTNYGNLLLVPSFSRQIRDIWNERQVANL